MQLKMSSARIVPSTLSQKRAGSETSCATITLLVIFLQEQ